MNIHLTEPEILQALTNYAREKGIVIKGQFTISCEYDPRDDSHPHDFSAAAEISLVQEP